MWNKISRFIFGERLLSRMPERVRASINRRQAESEILIGWVQLVLVLFFVTLYSIAPKTSAGTGFTPVPWALGMYFLFTLLRLWLTYRRSASRGFLAASVIMDIGLLMVLIWSFHIQYEQPPSFYLKAPTVLYVFIFISLRALRFEAGYILLAGLVAAAGWSGLVFYVIFSEPGNPMITRDYVEYMTSNSILIGAEIDKIVSILLVTTVLAVAIIRAQRIFQRAVLDSITAEDLSKFVSPEIADRITTADRAIQPGDGEVKLATVLFTDIEGFSSIAERLRPEELMKTLNEYFAAISTILDRHRGVITQFEGDAMLITFNTAKPDPDHAANAVKTALEIQREISNTLFGGKIQLKTRCGINTGNIISGAVGTRDRLLFTVHGDEVNIAARLEQLNKDYDTYILVTEQTARHAGAAFQFERIGEVVVRGREAPTDVYTVTE
ncbi:MAG: adenylate/guanylate cyclase domain-containing protein [Rhodospirillales bacterium]|nr:adenylate/guanylate cyclase domain-containing protein [Rhodospirillales bacterium]